MKYEKIPTTVEEQLELLKARGLTIDNEERAIKYLNYIGYYRLSGYMYHFQLADGTHQFKEGVTFADIADTYTFDKKLRYLMAGYLERIEVAMRAWLTNVYSAKHGFYWYTDPSHYVIIAAPDDIQERVDKGEIPMPRKYLNTHQYVIEHVTENFQKATEQFIIRFKSKYTGEVLPPSNMAMEILSMGKLARLFEALKNSPEKQAVANAFDLPNSILASWLIYLTNIRNICAHHGRLWNRRTTADRFNMPARPTLAFKGELDVHFNSSFYGTLAVTLRLLHGINPDNSLLAKFQALLAEYPKINIAYMGFPKDWEKNPAWG